MREKLKSIRFNLMIVILAVVILGSIIFSINNEKKYIKQDEIETFSFIGTYQFTEDGPTYPLKGDSLSNSNEHESVILKGHFTKDFYENDQIYFRLVNLSADIYIGNHLIYSVGHKNTIPDYADSPGNIWCTLYTPRISRSDDVTIYLHNLYQNNNAAAYNTFLRSFCTGDKLSLLLTKTKQKSFFIGAFLITTMIGFIIFMGSIFLLIIHSPINKTAFYFSIYLIISGLCMEIEYSYISLIIPYGISTGIAETILFLLLFPSLVHYLKTFLSHNTRRIAGGCENLSYLFVIFYLIHQFAGWMDGYEFQHFYAPIGFVGSAVVFFCILYDARVYHKKTVKHLFIHIVITALIAVWAYFFFHTSGRPGYYFTACGIMFFSLTQILFLIGHIRSGQLLIQKASVLEEEVAQSRISLLTGQIQPHFFFNSLTAIKQLCVEDPYQASCAIDNLSNFLRQNMDLMKVERTIPFNKELEFVKSYFYLQKMRYEDRIDIEYHLLIENFYIPPLTIQPIVENAIKYGITRREEGGKITISTIEKANSIQILIQDNGIGFDTNKEFSTERSHVGIENVRKRIEGMCKGTLKISSKPGHGTSVFIQIPKELI